MQLLHITVAVMMNLHAMRAEPKFVDDPTYHPPSKAIQVASSAKLDELLDRLIVGLPKQPQKSYLLREFARTLHQFDEADSEEQDRVGHYLERVMDIVHVERSDGLINQWRYGFDPTKPLPR